MEPDGRRTNLTRHPARDHLPAWSPDGERIVFSSRRDGNDEVYVMRADGSGIRNLTNHPSVDVMAKWSPDGTRIVFVSNRDGGFRLHVMTAEGTDVRPVER